MSMAHLKKQSRLVLTSYHLFYSITLSLLISAVIYFIWYPYHLYQALGVVPTVLMIVAVNLIVAPLLTFIVYKDDKKELTRDLIVILMLQIVALGYGFYIVEAGRPAYLVFTEDNFQVVTAFDNDWAQNNISIDKAKAQPLGLFEKPKFVYSIPPVDEGIKKDRLSQEFVMDVPTIYRIDSYQAIETAASIIQSRAQPLTTLSDNNSNKKVQNILRQYPDADSWLPLKAPVLDMVVLIDNDKVLDIVDLRP